MCEDRREGGAGEISAGLATRDETEKRYQLEWLHMTRRRESTAASLLRSSFYCQRAEKKFKN